VVSTLERSKTAMVVTLESDEAESEMATDPPTTSDPDWSPMCVCLHRHTTVVALSARFRGDPDPLAGSGSMDDVVDRWLLGAPAEADVAGRCEWLGTPTEEDFPRFVAAP
jgi:hypothetical protein